MNVSAPATKSKRKRAKTSRTGGNTKQPEPPRVNSTVDLIFSLMMMSVTPWLFILKFIVDLLRGRSSQRENKQNVSTIDTHSDAVLLKLNESSHVLTTISGGCHVLEYLLHGGEVTAVDEDMYQVALLELKSVCILHLPFDQFFTIFGQSNIQLLKSVYECSLRSHLSKETAQYWDKELPKVWSFMYAGGARGYLSWILFRFFLPFVGLGFIEVDLRTGVAAPALCDKLRGYKFRLQTLAYLTDAIVYRVGLCLPSSLGSSLCSGVGRTNTVSSVVEKVFFQSNLVDENYLIAGYIMGEYTMQNAPKYLQQEMNYYSLRIALNENKLSVIRGTLISSLAELTQKRRLFTAASFHDAFDDMTARDINTLLAHLIPCMDSDTGGARILWRSVEKKVHAAPLALLRPKAVVDRRDKLGTGDHWSTWVADVDACPVEFEPRCYNAVPQQSTVAGLVTGLQMVTFCLWKPFMSPSTGLSGHALLMESFYKIQRDSYDGFRESMLHARPQLMTALPLKKGDEMTWVDVGGGTARVLEYFDTTIIKKYFKKIVIIDVASSLLEVARQRVCAMKLEDIVQIIELDFTEAEALSKLSIPVHTVDIVTFSYSLSMISKPTIAIENASKLLKRNGEGILAIADLFESSKHDKHLPALYQTLRRWESSLQKRWFAVDNVQLLSDAQLRSASTV